MATVGIHEAKTTLSKLIKRMAAGEEVVITNGGRPVAQLVPPPAQGPRTFGLDRGLVQIADDFDDTPAELAPFFE